MAEALPVLLPGDAIDAAAVPSHKKLPLRLGPGLRLVPPQEIVPTVAGRLAVDRKKNSIWLDYNGGRYVPAAGDLVIGQVHHASGDFYHVSLAPYAPHALLPLLAFEGASRKTRPVLSAGALVYARVAAADRHMDAELECVHPATGRAEGLGPLPACTPENPSTVFAVSTGLARRLLMPKPARDGAVAVLDELGAAGLAFETAVGRNGRVWVGGGGGGGGQDASAALATVALVGRALTETDAGRLDVPAQKKLVRRLLKEAEARGRGGKR